MGLLLFLTVLWAVLSAHLLSGLLARAAQWLDAGVRELELRVTLIEFGERNTVLGEAQRLGLCGLGIVGLGVMWTLQGLAKNFARLGDYLDNFFAAVDKRPVRGLVPLALLALALMLICASAQADPPRAAVPYRTTVVRLAHAEAGLNAPIALYAAQIQQESAWNPQAVSAVGARGLAQFMPATAQWMRQRFPQLKTGTPENPQWAIRALVAYDQWLYRRVKGYNEGDKYWAVLRSYNGGLGHWQKEAALAATPSRADIDAACGKASRARKFCAENLGYPRRIFAYQPNYLSWGGGVAWKG